MRNRPVDLASLTLFKMIGCGWLVLIIGKECALAWFYDGRGRRGKGAKSLQQSMGISKNYWKILLLNSDTE
jgi:hypothetical protein